MPTADLLATPQDSPLWPLVYGHFNGRTSSPGTPVLFDPLNRCPLVEADGEFRTIQEARLQEVLDRGGIDREPGFERELEARQEPLDYLDPVGRCGLPLLHVTGNSREPLACCLVLARHDRRPRNADEFAELAVERGCWHRSVWPATAFAIALEADGLAGALSLFRRHEGRRFVLREEG